MGAEKYAESVVRSRVAARLVALALLGGAGAFAAGCGDSGAGGSRPGDADTGMDGGMDTGDDAEPGDAASDIGDEDGDTSTPTPDTSNDNPFADPGPGVLELASVTGCFIDADCAAGLFCLQGVCAVECLDDATCPTGERCSDRGRCVLDGSGGGTANEVTSTDRSTTISLARSPEPLIRVPRGTTSVEYVVHTTGGMPGESLIYRLERNDGLSDPEQAHRVELQADGTLRFTLDAGAARPEGDNAIVSVRLVLPFGSQRVVLQPEVPAQGEYAGQVFLTGFGPTGLPVELRIFTQPDGVALADATSAELALRVAREHIFSPVATAPDGWVVAPLVFQEFVGRYVATFNQPFELPAGSRLDRYPDGQLQRQIRIELNEPFDDFIEGSIVDRWIGLFDQRTAQGTPSVGELSMVGTFEAQWRAAIGADERPGPVALPAASPTLQPAPMLTWCDAEALMLDDVADLSCAGIVDAASFEGAALQDQFACSLALADQALAGDTTTRQLIAFLDDDIENPGGLSFAEFMARCAAGTDGTCRPTEEVLCARELIAHSLHAVGASSSPSTDVVASVPNMISTFQELTREAFLGRQLGAFQTDVNTRLRWLRSTDFPAIVTAAVRSFTADLLREWEETVLNVHMDTLADYFDEPGLLVLTSAGAIAPRRRMIAEVAQTWRGALDALTIAVQRWDALFQDDAPRADRTRYVQESLLDLYLTAGMLHQFASDTGSTAGTATIAGGFSALLRATSRLALPFDELIFARDAEVVVSTSLNPLEDNDSLLRRRRTEAETELAAAATAIETILDRTQAEALSEALLRNELTNEINVLREELANLCGVPVGCTPAEVRTLPECSPRTGAGVCGFARARGEDDSLLPFANAAHSISEAGRAQLEILSAMQGVSIASAEQDAHVHQTRLELQQLMRYQRDIAAWRTRREARLNQMRGIFARRAEVREEMVRTIFENMDERAEVRANDIGATRELFEEWDRIRLGNLDVSFALAIAQAATSTAADTMRNLAEMGADYAKAASDGLPTTAGTSTDPSFPARLAIGLGKAGMVAGLRSAAIGFDVAAAGVGVAKDRHDAMSEARMARLQNEFDVGVLEYDNEIALLTEAAERARIQGEADLSLLDDARRLLIAEGEAWELYQQNYDEFLVRRLAFLQRLTRTTELTLRVAQAGLRVQQRTLEYLQIVQRADLIEARLADLEAQRTNIEILIGSPAAVFSRANRLAQAESRLMRAKSAILDWLVALEYFAVRPFIDERIQILLANNTYQLEAIVARMKQLEERCGGPVNQSTATFSLRDDFLGITQSILDPVTGTELSPSQRFRETLSEGLVSVNRRIRYATDANIGDLMRINADVLAATFQVNLTDFANLATTCNAKVVGIEIELVGDIGSGRPTASVLYDGTAQLRSCQPGIDELVAPLGAGTTSFGSITTVRTAGRSMSPIAGVGSFLPDNMNRTFSGLPLASQYTVLIPVGVGENRNMNWGRLEDVRLRIRYGYNDIFPTGQCL